MKLRCLTFIATQKTKWFNVVQFKKSFSGAISINDLHEVNQSIVSLYHTKSTKCQTMAQLMGG